VGTVQDAAKRHGISGHAAALRWTAFHSALDGNYGDGIIFGASKIKQLHDSRDALEAVPLPAELAEAMGAIYEKVEVLNPFAICSRRDILTSWMMVTMGLNNKIAK
jgi:aryl-alcohol dehydrogenase-like predicted oxidoreductase